MKYIIIGGVAGGATAAARLRRVDEKSDILLLEKGKYISYANCGLPYYIGGVIDEREKLLVQTPASFGQRFRVDVRVENEVIAIHPQNKTITVRTVDGGEYEETYDKLLLSPGATPVRPSLGGIDSEGIFTLRNVEDTDRIKSYLTEHAVKRAVVVGAGFIGLEMAENLHHAGVSVSVVEMGNQVMAPIDFSMAAPVHQHLVQKGVSLYLEEGVTHFQRTEQGITVFLKSGKTIPADMVLLSIGVRPATALAKDAGLKIGEAGGIWVNEYLETSEKDIYAVGDAIEYPHPLTGKPWLNYLANPANRQGRIVADNMVFGNKVSYEGAIGTSIAKVFDMTVASTGLAAKRLKQWEMEYQSSVTHSASHAGYYPDALPLTLKLTFHPVTGKLYGAQCIGYEGVDKRIDQIARLIKRGGTVYDLMETEHTYAPPFSSAKDPIAIAGYVASNIISGAMPIITWRELVQQKNEVMLIDTRTPEEFSFGSIPGAINIPLDDLRDRMSEVPTSKPVVLFCAVGLRGYLAQRILMGNGYRNVRNLSGGYKLYSAAVAPVPVPDKVITPQVNSIESTVSSSKEPLKINACGLQCPGPIMQVKKAMDTLAPGEQVEIVATDAGFARDASAWCDTTGNRLIGSHEEKGRYTVTIEKGDPAAVCPSSAGAIAGRGKTLILFSDDLDKALATFVLANGAAATGQKVTVFFTFWGLNVLKKVQKPKVKKDIFGKMFGMMLPSSSLNLKLSKMNMFGMGSRMMRFLMKQKGVDSLESLRSQALAQGVEFIACQMSMDMMGISREELLDEVTIGGVATYMERADKANVNLFI
ncbi:pyridine nucleotide-disulfide oxidoreductase [Bacteroides intestinalis CAG:315]|uniref:Pyridine nucleotide-disulfide oxidoreductase n=1 Tax=Bacteroides intestinalis TaxID=329854 RepID=A0A412XUN0_9BACE|nr:FAD-dependent oxidoreductase [Bacteroides intestinalis]RGV48789.1 pyridine nucleotide-disulfide oxidoreductase [Bacteroides intestinalis]RHA55079.1 pyridine nucleotide-disulfide oxidoreductase [Bacteroides intestinalis]CDD91519.1 pyridine nucleotide-disulfide oxidoreductase [Bacteroides intestinalis CAG:315]